MKISGKHSMECKAYNDKMNLVLYKFHIKTYEIFMNFANAWDYSLAFHKYIFFIS